MLTDVCSAADRNFGSDPEAYMPFTPTHVLAVVPFASAAKWLPFSALAIGCMVPDLPLFIPWLGYAQTHSLLGVLTFCVPLGLLIFTLFQWLLKVPLVALLPTWFQRRMGSYTLPNLSPTYRFYLGVCVALAIGAATHIVWDAFTHQGRWGTEFLPWLNENVVLFGREVPNAKIVQHACTVVGLPWLGLIWLRQLRSTQPAVQIIDAVRLTAKEKLLGWALVVGPPIVIGIIKLITEPTIPAKAFVSVTSAGTLWMVTTVTYALLHRWLIEWPKRRVTI